jgi:RsiW-degrading membrane proteinase PrsW (M82 family)
MILHGFLALLPVCAFLLLLQGLDTYRLLRLRSVLATIAWGMTAAGAALCANTALGSALDWEWAAFTRYASPAVEEVTKGFFLFFLFARNRIGFMVDAAIRGFALGAGFALIENGYYLALRPDADVLLWVVRGFGTALMHGGVTAIAAVIVQSAVERDRRFLGLVLPLGIGAAAVLHSLFNHLIVNPLLATLAVVAGLPLLALLVFRESERRTQRWLGIGFDTDRELLAMITTGVLAENRIGEYLRGLQDRFPGEVVADMLCVLRLHLELSVRAKGLLMMRDAGFTVPADPEVRHTFEELRYLEQSIGRTGSLALRPFLHTRTRDLWQITMLG